MTSMTLKSLVLLGLFLGSWALPHQIKPREAEECTPDNCKLPDCRCSNAGRPENLELSETPQFVFLTFDDAVTVDHFDKFYKTALFSRTNPDGCPIGVTHFVSHQYTDYSKVHELYINNHEIALHSTTHSPYTAYWNGLTLDEETAEFSDNAEIIAHFANIPREAIQGMRVPLLQLNGDLTFQAGKDIGLTYDCSWPTQDRQEGIWPYTLDYATHQDCSVGKCPTSSIPGFWVAPMIDWLDIEDNVCSMVDGCIAKPESEDDLFKWFQDNFNVQYNGEKAPWGYFMHAAFFDADERHFNAYIRFLDYLATLPDVYIVSVGRAIEWIKHPVAIGSAEWPACPTIVDDGCPQTTTQLTKVDDGTTMYMTHCAHPAPQVYPWLGNPMGEKTMH